MKLNILRLSIILLSSVIAVVVFAPARAQKTDTSQVEVSAPLAMQTPAATAGQEKTVEQVEKNIKVLAGMPQSQFLPVMNYFAASLGRRCNFCHVNNNGQWDYASDAKPEKNTAREMVKMVLDVNKNTFKGNTEVGCYTCHRGRNNPQSIPTLPLPTPSPAAGGSAGPGAPGAGSGAATPGSQPQASPTPRPTPVPAEEIINKYMSNIGGQAIDNIKSRTATGTVTTANGITGTYEIGQVAADRVYEIFVTPRFTIRRAVTGTSAWEQNAQGVRDIAGVELARVRNTMLLFSNLKLKDQYTRLRTVGREKVGDRDAYVVLAARSDTDVDRLYFDVETGLLLRRITYIRTVVGVIPEQTDFEDYREVDGVKFPFTVRVSAFDAGNAYIIRKLNEIKVNASVDESKFNAPPAQPKP